MNLEQLEVWNFRGIGHLKLELHPQLTLIIGENGAGKTSLLDALAIGLSQYVARLTKTVASAKRIADDDVKIGAPDARIKVTVGDGPDEFRWSVIKQGQRDRVLKPIQSDYRGVSELAKKIAQRQDDPEEYLNGETPVIFYNQRRAVLDIPQRKRGTVSHKASDAFAESLNVGSVDFRKLTYWFQERETEELRLQRRNKSYIDTQLDAVRRAITTSTGLKEPYYRIDAPRGLVFTKAKVELHANQLSTGEKIYMALAGDLARRLAIINTRLKRPLSGRAIVLIDEIELHLHPVWQRQIVSWLTATFPRCQFILTTHSPQVLSEVRAESIRVLTVRSGRVKLHTVRASYGRDSNYLLAAAFGADERPLRIKKRIDDIDAALAGGRLDRAEREIRALRQEVEGEDPQVDIAEARLARRANLRSQ